MPADFQHLRSSGEMSRKETRGFDEVALTALYQERLEPIIRKYIISKFRVSMRPDDDGRQNQDALELLSETKVLVFQKLSRLQNRPGKDAIRDLDAYVRTITANVFNQYLRRKYPRRLSLKNQFQYLLTHHRDLSLWKDDADQWICGSSFEAGRRTLAKRIALTGDQRDELCSRVSRVRGKGREIIEFTLGIFEYHDAPAKLDDLVMTAIELMNIDEPFEVAAHENVADPRSSSDRVTALTELEDSEFVRRLWDEVKQLSIQHRVVLLMNFKDDPGDDLISLLPVMRIASLRQIADVLGFSHQDFANIWNELPWDDTRIAGHLGVTRQQVVNLRQSARQMLRRRLGPRN